MYWPDPTPLQKRAMDLQASDGLDAVVELLIDEIEKLLDSFVPDTETP